MHLSVVVFIFPAFFAGLPTVALYTCSLHTSLCTLPSHHLGKVRYGRCIDFGGFFLLAR